MAQTLKHPGDPGYKLVAARDMHLPSVPKTSSFFRGGVRSKPSTAVAPAPHAPRTFSPGTPTLYNNLNKAGMGADGVTPPDSTGAIGPNNYVEMDNSNITVYDRSLNFVSTVSLDGFLSTGGFVPFCDVQVQWDPTANRWLLSFLFCNTSSSVQIVEIAWSKTSDPSNLLANNTSTSAGTGGWCAFAFRNDPYLLDFPKLGHNATFMVVGGNLYNETFPSGNPPFVSAGIEWASLPSSNADTSCTSPASAANSGLGLKNGDGTTPAFTPVPVNNTTNAPDDYVVSAYDPAGNTAAPAGPKNKLAVWRLDSAGVLHAANDLTVTTFDVPTAAQQPGSADQIDTLDARLTQAVGDATTGIYTQHTVSSAGGVSEVDWYEITASGGVASLVQQGAIALASTWVYNAAISPRFDGQGAAIFYNTSSGSKAIDIETKIRRPSTAAGTFEAGSTTLASSSASVTDFSCNNPTLGIPCRWGDYAGASPDPVQTNVVWGTNMFNTASGSSPAWSDENFAVYAAVRPNAPLVTSARADGRGDAAITWTPSTFDPGAPVTSFEVLAFVGGVPGPNVVVPSASAAALQFRGLTLGTTYTFAVFAINAVGFSPQSPMSSPVTITGGVVQSTPGAPPSRSPDSQSIPAPPPSR